MKNETPSMKVKDLVAHLLTGDQEADVVTFGHFGEIYEVDKYNFNFRKIKKDHNPQGVVGAYLAVTTPDIGKEPD